LNGIHQLLVYANDFNRLSDNMNNIKTNTEALLEAIRGAGLEVSTGNTTYVCVLSPKYKTKSKFADTLKMCQS
jgi:hypothetical protein